MSQSQRVKGIKTSFFKFSITMLSLYNPQIWQISGLSFLNCVAKGF